MHNTVVFWQNEDVSKDCFKSRIEISVNEKSKARIFIRTYCDTATVYDISEEKLRELRNKINAVLGE